jgi:diguanylate cyclase (GGDEF)-like protein
LRETLRASDFVARLGGDEFVVVLPDTGEPPAAAALVERIAGELAAAPIPELADGMVTASIGKASYPLDGATAEALIAAADRAMYRVKQGRHRAARKRAAPREPSPLTLGQALPA